MGDFNKMSEDEEDLDALRLAALQSLKKKTQINDTNQFNNNSFNNERLKNRRGKYYRPNQNRNLRNGQLSNWNRNSNLIAVPVISNENDDNQNDDTNRLILPQDRYCKNTKILDANDENTNSPLSKFDRYDNSDKSDSDSDDNDGGVDKVIDDKDEDKDDTLKRTNSLEALMEELENEINGETKKIDDKTKDEKVKNKKKKRNVENETATTTTTTAAATTTTTITSPTTKPTVAKENLKPDSSENTPNITPTKSNFHKKKWQPRNSRRPNFQPKLQNEFLPRMIQQQQSLNIVPQFPPTIPLQFPIYNQFPLYNQQPSPMNIFEQQQHFTELPPRVPIYDQQQTISPLHINTTTTPTTIMAPLSPRSAAFVLENRAIIEKRKRRSYSPSSRSTSRSSSNSRLSLSPRYRRSKSPPRSPLIKRQYSPPKSPIRRVLLPPKIQKNPPSTSTSIHERLGIKNDKTDKPMNDDNKFNDPIMEARRKKFESNQLIMKEGVIRLKTKIDDNKHEKNEVDEDDGNDKKNVPEIDNNNDNDDIDEDALLEDAPDDLDLELNPKFDVLFSDEESNSDNEGRFKIKQEQNEQKVVVLPFTKLINGTKTASIETKLKDNNDKNSDNKEKSKNNNNNNDNSGRSERRKRNRSKSPTNQQSSSSKKIALKTKKIDKTNKSINSSFPIIDNKKIEIKIRNPAKYEENDNDNKNKDNGRKVEILGTTTTTNQQNDKDNNDNKDSLGKISEGDLRAQLSRKRAERMKQPLPDVVPSRLLQNALQSVGFDKGKKIKIDKNDNKDVKLPIRLRLGTTTTTTTATTPSSSSNNSSNGNNTDGFGKKIRKRGSLEQV